MKGIGRRLKKKMLPVDIVLHRAYHNQINSISDHLTETLTSFYDSPPKTKRIKRKILRGYLVDRKLQAGAESLVSDAGLSTDTGGNVVRYQCATDDTVGEKRP